jgi:cytochrome c556
MKYRIKPLLTSLVVALSVTVLTQEAFADAKPETLIKFRQSAFSVVGWHCSRIKSNIDGKYSKDEVVKSATAIASIVNGDLFPQFAAGTDQGKGWHDTAAKSELFSNNKRFAELASNLSKDSGDLAKLAATTDDVAVIKTQFGKVAQSCKACHDDFRRKDF